MRLDRTYRDLGSLCTIKGRIGFRGYTREDLVNKGEGAITLSPSNIIDDKLDLTKCSYISWFKYNESPEIMIFEGDIIYAKTASIGKVAIVVNLPEKATINPQFVVLKDIKCNRRYLYYCLRSTFFRAQADNIVRGVAIPTLSQANLSLLSVPVPPLAEQERIVAELDLLSGIIDKQKAQLKELETLAQSIFYDMFGSPVHNEKQWKTQKLGAILKTTSGGTPSKGHPEYYEGGTIPWVNSGDLHQMYITSVPKTITEAGLKNSSAKLFPVDTVLMAMYGATVGEVSILKTESTTNQAVCGIFPNSYYTPIFLYSVLKYSKDFFVEIASGGAQPNISQNIIKDYLLITPSMEEQVLFADKIANIECQKESINQSIAESQKLFDYTMDKYFG